MFKYSNKFLTLHFFLTRVRIYLNRFLNLKVKSVFKITISKKKLKNFSIFFILLLPVLIITFFSSNVLAWVGPSTFPPMENVAMVNSCEYAFGPASSCPYGCLIHPCSIVAVGGECGGGKVAYHDGAGGGFIAHTTDNSEGIQWGCRGQSVDTSIDIGTGLANTNAIVAFHNDTSNFGGHDYYTYEGWDGTWSTNEDTGCYNRNDGTVAAKLCYDLATGGHTDWFLPSTDELNELFVNRAAIGNFSSAYYWSSSENGTSYAWTQNFDSGFQANSSSKTNTYRVRCVRAF